MDLSIMNKRILSYIESNISLELADKYYNFLSTGLKINRHELKKMAKFVKSKNTDALEIFLLKLLPSEIVEDFPIDVTLQHEKNTLPNSSNLRVKKHREKIKLKGYKNLSTQLPAVEYQKLKDLKIKKQMTYQELIIFLINQ